MAEKTQTELNYDELIILELIRSFQKGWPHGEVVVKLQDHNIVNYYKKETHQPGKIVASKGNPVYNKDITE